jgi:hypothetical protein
MKYKQYTIKVAVATTVSMVTTVAMTTSPYPDEELVEGAGEEGMGESTVDFLTWRGDSEGEGRGSTAPDGGGYRHKLSERPLRT